MTLRQCVCVDGWQAVIDYNIDHDWGHDRRIENSSVQGLEYH